MVVSGISSGPSYPAGNAPVNASGTANDYAAVNQGEVKKMATAAAAEFDSLGLTGSFDAMVAQWQTPTSQTNDYAAVNLGQLKAVAQPFYDSLIAGHYLLATSQYPWLASGGAPNDYAMANIGQLKNLFSFSVVPPAPPIGFSQRAQPDGSVALTWQNSPANLLTGAAYSIQISRDGGQTWTVTGTAAPGATTYTVPPGAGSALFMAVGSNANGSRPGPGSGLGVSTPTPPVQTYAAIESELRGGRSGTPIHRDGRPKRWSLRVRHCWRNRLAKLGGELGPRSLRQLDHDATAVYFQWGPLRRFQRGSFGELRRVDIYKCVGSRRQRPV